MQGAGATQLFASVRLLLAARRVSFRGHWVGSRSGKDAHPDPHMPHHIKEAKAEHAKLQFRLLLCYALRLA